MSAKPAQQRVLFQIGLTFGEHEHLDAGEDEECAKDVENPGELGNQPDAGQDHAGAHDDRAEDAVEKHSPLQFRRDREIAEDHDENEHVIDRQ